MGDYVEILDSTMENATSRGKFCGYMVKRYPLVSTKNKLLIKFHTDDERASRGFVFTYEVDGTGRFSIGTENMCGVTSVITSHAM